MEESFRRTGNDRADKGERVLPFTRSDLQTVADRFWTYDVYIENTDIIDLEKKNKSNPVVKHDKKVFLRKYHQILGQAILQLIPRDMLRLKKYQTGMPFLTTSSTRGTYLLRKGTLSHLKGLSMQDGCLRVGLKKLKRK